MGSEDNEPVTAPRRRRGGVDPPPVATAGLDELPLRHQVVALHLGAPYLLIVRNGLTFEYGP